MKRKRLPNIDPWWNEERVAAALARAVREAIERHRRLGEPIAVMRNGRAVLIPASEIPPLVPEQRRRIRTRGKRSARATRR